MAKYLILAVAATLLVACEAGWWATPVNPPSRELATQGPAPYV